MNVFFKILSKQYHNKRMTYRDLYKNKGKFLRSILFIIGFAYSLSYIITISNNDLSALLEGNKLFYIISSLSFIYLGILLSKVRYQFEAMFKFILITIFLHTLYFSLLHCHYSYSVFLHFIAISIATLIITNFKTAFSVLTVSSVICFFSRPIAEYLKISKPIIISSDNVNAIQKFEGITIVYSLVIITYIGYFYIKLKGLEKELTKLKFGSKQSDSDFLEETDDNIARFENLYNEIVAYFEEEKPFTDPDFSINMLSKTLKTNSTYISKALNQVGNKKFNVFVNQYRIQQVIEDLDNKKHKKHTLEHIYTKAGFTQQSTFNRVFKEFIGVTPTEYIDKLNRE